jgi:hypothetical protein
MLISGDQNMKSQNETINQNKLVKRYTMTLESPGGRRESMFSSKIGTLVNELIRLRDGHNWKVIKDIKREVGYLGNQGNFYPIPGTVIPPKK